MATQLVNLLNQVKGYYIGTKSAVEALAGVPEGSIAYATDTDEFGTYDGADWTWGTMGAGGGVTDHGALTGLGDDDHTQYHNDARGDVRYAPIAKGVTNGDTHDHNGGDGNAIAYSTLTGTPTIPDTETIQDIVGAMFSGNTETGISITYDDSDGTIDADAQTAGDTRYLRRETAVISSTPTTADSVIFPTGGEVSIVELDLSGLTGNRVIQFAVLANQIGTLWAVIVVAGHSTYSVTLGPDTGNSMTLHGSSSNWDKTVQYERQVVIFQMTSSTDMEILSTYGFTEDTGWIAMGEQWTRTGNHTFTVSGDLTDKYRKNTKIRYKDGGSYEYGVVGAVSHAAGTTTVTLITTSDYAMAAATITDRYISYIESPEGFPQWFNWSPSPSNLTLGSGGTTTAKWQVSGQRFSYEIAWILGSSPTVGDVSFTVPVATASPGSRQNQGICTLLDSGTQNYFGAILTTGSTTMNIRANDVSGSHVVNAVLSSTNPFTWAVNDGIFVSGWFSF